MQSKMSYCNKITSTKLIILLLGLLFSMYSCSNKQGISKDSSSNKQDTLKDSSSNEQDLSKYHTTLDTVHIKTGISSGYYDDEEWIISFTKDEYNKLVDNHPEFFYDGYDVEEAYDNCSLHHFYGGQAGEDEYYLVYAHFLKNKNGDKELEKERKALLQIYREINYMHGSLRGGTGYGHKYIRISGIVEDDLEEMLYYLERSIEWNEPIK